MRVRVRDAKAFWEDLKGELSGKTGVRAAFDAAQDLYDPNINYTQDIAALDTGVAA